MPFSFQAVASAPVNREQLVAAQTPLKEKYRENPGPAVVTLQTLESSPQLSIAG